MAKQAIARFTPEQVAKFLGQSSDAAPRIPKAPTTDAGLHGEQLRRPAKERLAEIAEREKGGQTFLGRAMARILGDNVAMTGIKGRGDKYKEIMQRMLDSRGRAHLSREDKQFMRDFRAETLERVTSGGIDDGLIDRTLHSLSAQGHGTMSRDEFLNAARWAWSQRLEHPDAFAREADEMLRYVP